MDASPLSERRESIPTLTRDMMTHFANQDGIKVPQLTGRAEDLLKNYDWPGGERELRAVMERAMLLAAGDDKLDAQYLPEEIANPNAPRRPVGEIIPFVEEERRILKHALEVTGGKIPEAARRLAIGRATLYRKVKKYGLR